MSSSGQIGDSTDAGFEATLHLVTHVAIPEGLEGRVYSALETAPRQSRLLAWLAAAVWLRHVAAAAIVVVVAGGGWGVYRNAQLHQPAKVTVSPAPPVTAPATGGFSSAGAIRTPQTVKGPAVDEPSKANAEKKPSAVKPVPQGDTDKKNPANGTSKRSAVKSNPLAVEPALPSQVPSGKLSTSGGK